jgi:hypothetical protein
LINFFPSVFVAMDNPLSVDSLYPCRSFASPICFPEITYNKVDSTVYGNALVSNDSPTFHTDNKLQTRHSTLFFFFDEKVEVG